MIFCNIQTDFNFIFGQFSVARKLILNGGAIRPIGLLFNEIVAFVNERMYILSNFTYFTRSPLIARQTSTVETIKVIFTYATIKTRVTATWTLMIIYDIY